MADVHCVAKTRQVVSNLMHGSNMGNAICMKLGHNQSHETLKHKMKGSHAKQVLA